MRGKFLKTMALTAVVSVIAGMGVARADTVYVNDVVTAGNTTKAPGSTGAAYVYMDPTNGTPTGDETGCNAGEGSAVTVTLASNNAGVTFPSGNTASIERCRQNSDLNGDSVDYAVANSASGTATISITSVTGGKTSGTRLFNSVDTLVITISAPSDTTPPVITRTITGTAGSNGWYTSNVSVAWTVTDAQSAVTIVSGCGTQQFTSETASATSSCSASSAGGPSSDSVSLKIDKTGPSATLTPSGTTGDNGWYTGTVTIATSGSDSISNPTTCTADQSQTADTTGAAFNGSCTNAAGLQTNADSITVKKDATSPSVSVSGVSHGSEYTLGSVPTAGCSTSDATSGVADSATLGSSGGPVGSITASCSGAKDNAGNTAGTASATYSVVYNFGGFKRPIDSLPTLNVAKAGSSIPVKFSLNGDQGMSIFSAGGPTSARLLDAAGNTDSVEVLATAGSSGLQYDSLTDTYTYVWKTDKAWAGQNRVLQLSLADGTTKMANFKLTK